MSLPRGLKTLMLALKIQFPSAWWLMRDLDPELYQCSYKAEHLLQRKAIHQTKKKKKKKSPTLKLCAAGRDGTKQLLKKGNSLSIS